MKQEAEYTQTFYLPSGVKVELSKDGWVTVKENEELVILTNEDVKMLITKWIARL